ncbi:hypothetical protein AB4Z39_26070 [Mycobacterium adipatum]|uniref:hypothetical protein n=1 Tax=Mycobacterium adipatum TaxID=1682113 RepID=UPI0034E09F87
MDTTVVYEIARFQGFDEDSPLLDRLQLVAVGGALKLRDGDGTDLLCDGTDVAAVIAATPALRTVGGSQQVRITCGDDIMGQLPLLLGPVPKDAYLLVNDEGWEAFPDAEGDHVMLPGECDYDCSPELSTWWAEYRCAEGGADFDSQVMGHSAIGLLAPGVAVERGRTDYGGNGGAAAVSVRQFDDFATVFVEWLLRTPILSSFWPGDQAISSPGIELMTEAASAADRHGYWEYNGSPEEPEEVDDETDDQSWDGVGSFASMSLDLRLPPNLVNEVQRRLKSLYPGYAAPRHLQADSSSD